MSLLGGAGNVKDLLGFRKLTGLNDRISTVPRLSKYSTPQSDSIFHPKVIRLRRTAELKTQTEEKRANAWLPYFVLVVLGQVNFPFLCHVAVFWFNHAFDTKYISNSPLPLACIFPRLLNENCDSDFNNS